MKLLERLRRRPGLSERVERATNNLKWRVVKGAVALAIVAGTAAAIVCRILS